MNSSAGADRFDALAGTPLTDGEIDAQIRPLFSRVLAAHPGRVYLANHSLGRPLDATADDVREALDLWTAEMGGAWDYWSAEMTAYRTRLAALLGAARADCVIPKANAGQGLRAVLNSYERVPRVVATRGEFDSLDVILRTYAERGRIALSMVEAHDGAFDAEEIIAAIVPGTDLVVVSQVMFETGAMVPGLPALVSRAHAVGARLLLDVYHSVGVLPVDVTALDVDFAVGGSYKYLRGGPGAAYLYVAPRHLDAGLATLDIGWFAKESPFTYARPQPPRFASGGDGWLESTPAVLPLYQARAGQRFTLAVGVERLREHSLGRQQRLVELLAGRGVVALGGTPDRGAFVVVRDPRARLVADRLAEQGIVTDARGPWLRLCPDLLTTNAEMEKAAAAVAAALR